MSRINSYPEILYKNNLSDDDYLVVDGDANGTRRIKAKYLISDSDLSSIEHVTPEMYGAIGDGTTDDVAAFEQAINSGKPVYIPAKTYYISRPLDFTNTDLIETYRGTNYYKVVLSGSGRGLTTIKLGYNTPTDSNDSITDLNGLFKKPIINSIISGIKFTCTNSDVDVFVFPANINNSRIMYCDFSGFDNIFNRLEVCCEITGNWFRGVKTSLCVQCVDAFITNNYLSGSSRNNNPQTTLFTQSLSNTVIQGNFFSYCYKVFAVKGTMQSLIVSGNMFALCYCIFYNHLNEVTFTGNSISGLKKPSSSDWNVSGNSDMDSKSWAVIKRVFENTTTDENAVSQWWQNSVFTGNVIKGDFDLYMDCDLYAHFDPNAEGATLDPARFPTYNILIDEIYDASKFIFFAQKNTNFSDDQKSIMIRPMLKRTVSELPDPDFTTNGHTVESFNNDEVIYNGDPYINVNGTWKHIPTGDGYLTLATLPIYNGGVQ